MSLRTLIVSCLVAAAPLALATGASAQDKVTYGTNWLAQAEHGGFYQAVADGTYAKYGLDVTIRQGGPQGANRSLLLAGKIDFYMGGMMTALDSVKEGVPAVTVATMFQKEPQIIMAHPESGVEKFDDLAKLPTLFLSKDGFISYFQYLKNMNVGFKDEQYKPYTFNPAPFLADKQSGQQGISDVRALCDRTAGRLQAESISDRRCRLQSLFDDDRNDAGREHKKAGVISAMR
jgi:NitT/TauT family transport system substrate-binding protein